MKKQQVSADLQRVVVETLARLGRAFAERDVDAAVAASAAHQVLPIGEITVIDKGPNAGHKVVYLRDPDGVTIEFIEAS